MTTGWGAGPPAWRGPHAAWTLARDTAAGRGPAAIKDIAPYERPDVIIALAVQVRSFLTAAALMTLTAHALPDPAADPGWVHDVPCAKVRQLASAALSAQTVRIPGSLCGPCTIAAMAKMTEALLDAMAAAGTPRGQQAAALDWLASRARH